MGEDNQVKGEEIKCKKRKSNGTEGNGEAEKIQWKTRKSSERQGNPEKNEEIK